MYYFDVLSDFLLLEEDEETEELENINLQQKLENN